MKIGVFTILFNDRNLSDCLKYLSDLGVEAAEIGTGGYSKSKHCDLDEVLTSKKNLDKFKEVFAKNNITISALSCHGNPVHPKKEISLKDHEEFVKTIMFAEKIGVDTVLVTSGCPGGSPKDETPNWVTCPWPDDFLKILDYQWNEVLIPYWKKATKLAGDYGIKKIAIEPHPGFCVYNTETLLKLRKAVGVEIGVNFDPSHFFWQGMDPIEAIQLLNDSIFHFHAKDVYLNTRNISINGVLDAKHYEHIKERSWTFRTVGYGHSEETWKNIISALRTVGYDYVLSIEHEDFLMSKEEGLQKAVSFLKNIIIKEKAEGMWWA